VRIAGKRDVSALQDDVSKGLTTLISHLPCLDHRQGFNVWRQVK